MIVNIHLLLFRRSSLSNLYQENPLAVDIIHFQLSSDVKYGV